MNSGRVGASSASGAPSRDIMARVLEGLHRL